MGGCCIGEVLEILVSGIKSIFCSDCCVGYSSGPSESERHAKKIANELAEMKEKIGTLAGQEETELMDYIEQSMDVFLKEVESLNRQSFGGEYLRVNVNVIKEKNEALKKQVVGSVGQVLNKRLVQTDKELSVILGEKDDKKRKKNFDCFVDRVKKQAFESLKENIETTVKAQSSVVTTEIEGRLKEVNSRLEESVKELNEIMDAKKNSSWELEKKQFQYMYESKLCDFLLDEVEG